MRLHSTLLLLASFLHPLFLSASNAQSQFLCTEKEKQALLDFKLSFVEDPSGALSTWSIDGGDCCDWERVECDPDTGHVTSLYLYKLESYKLRPSLLQLQHLTTLVFIGDQFTMKIPSFIGSLGSLTSLGLSNAGFFGEIPPHLGNLTKLQHLDLSKSDGLYTRNLQWLSRLSSIESVDLSYVNLRYATDWVFALKMVPTLSEFKCISCSLPSPPLSSISHVVNSSTSLQTLDLSYNSVSSSTFSYLINGAKDLHSLSLNYMKSENNLHEFLEYLTGKARYSLKELSLVGNNLTNLPFERMMFPSLRSFNAASNEICGSLSVILHLSTQLSSLNLSHNRMSGMIQNSHLSYLSQSLYSVDLSYNSFHGPVPFFLFGASILDLSNNKFTSFAPSSHRALNLPNVTDFMIIDLSNNHLSALLPNWLFQFTGLVVLSLENNKLFGTLPEAVGSLWQLTSLHLSNNTISGQLPLSMKNCTQLAILELGNNNLSGVVPSWLGESIPQLAVLILRSNHFAGDMPFSLCNLQSLHIMDLSANMISGTIPGCLHNLSVMAIDKGSNFLNNGYFQNFESVSVIWKGRLVEFHSQTLELVKIINLSGNLLRGEIPIGVTDLTALNALDLSRNYLNGSIPPKLAQLESLEVLNISSNRLCGEIPESLVGLNSLSLLDMSSNNLSGRIPTGGQFPSFDPSCYGGNPMLCGDPLPTKCTRDADDGKKQPLSTKDGNEEEDESFDIKVFLASLGIGFITGLLGVLGILHFNRPWRLSFFQLGDKIAYRIFVATSLFQSRIKRSLCLRKENRTANM